MSDDDLAYPEPIAKDEEPLISSPEDQWTVNNSASMVVTEEIEEEAEEKTLDDSFPQINALEQGLSEWTMSVPGVIDSSGTFDKTIDLPPVIGQAKPAAVAPAPVAAKVDPAFDIKLPANDDLEYPDMGFGDHTPEDLPMSAPSVASKKPSYVSLDQFAPIEMSNEDATGEFVIDHTFNSDDSNVKEIEMLIADEVEEDLWHVDEFEELKKEVSAKMEEVKNNFQPTRNDFDESLFGDNEDRDAIKWNEPSNIFAGTQKQSVTADMKSEMEAMVKKYVQEYMDQMFQKSVEKVSWEIIPDLAENLIRQELGKISSKILNDK